MTKTNIETNTCSSTDTMFKLLQTQLIEQKELTEMRVMFSGCGWNINDST